MKTMNKKMILFIVLIVLGAMLLSGCGIESKFRFAKSFARVFINRIIEDDFSGAYNMMSDISTEAQFEPMYREMRKVLAGCEDYKLKLSSFNFNYNNGQSFFRAIYMIKTDDQKTALIELAFDDEENIVGANFVDRTEFSEKTNIVSSLNIIVIIFSVLCTAFSVWMCVDCIRHKMKNKVFWVLVTLVGLGLSVTVGESVFNLGFCAAFGYISSWLSSDPASASVSMKLLLPIGSLIYLIIRKKLYEAPTPEAQDQIETK